VIARAEATVALKALAGRVENVDGQEHCPICYSHIPTEGIMISKRLILNVIGLSLAISSQFLVPAIPSPRKEIKPQVASVKQNPERPALTEDEARLLVKEIPSVNIGETLARWSFSEPELAKLRQWSRLVVEQPNRTDFLSEWADLILKVKARNASLQNRDVVRLIQMLMSATYEEAHKDLDSIRERARFYKDMQERISGNVAEAERLQVLIRPQLNDPAASTLIRLPSYQRALKQCEVRSGSTPRLECREVLVATTMELDDYMAASAKEVQDAKTSVQKAELELQKAEQRRLQILEALSGTSKLMYDSAGKGAH